jgi:hypothetical protein
MSENDLALKEIRAKLGGTNINSTSLLATDYLNHINEAVMLLELIPDMPDCLEDVKEWRPKTYQQHFSDSGFSDKELAIEAYGLSPPEFKKPFDQTVTQLDEIIVEAIGSVEKLIGEEFNEQLGVVINDVTTSVQQLIERANAIINGSLDVSDQSDVDAIITGAQHPPSIRFSNAIAPLLYGDISSDTH